MSQNSILKTKSMAFAQRIVQLYRFLTREKQEYVMSKQLLRSGTSIGANIAEAIYGSSRKDFVAKRNALLAGAAVQLSVYPRFSLPIAVP